jgi:hypothetical protein
MQQFSARRFGQVYSRAAVWFAMLLDALVWMLEFRPHGWLGRSTTASLYLQSKEKDSLGSLIRGVLLL